MIAIQIIVLFAATTVLISAINHINQMTRRTHHGIRAAFVLIAAGSFAKLAAILDGHTPGVGETLFISGLGLLDFVERRGRFRYPFEHRITPHDTEREA